MSIKSEMLVSPKRSEPLQDVHLFIAGEAWDGIKKLAASRDVTASEVVRRLIAAELRRTAKPPKAAKTVAPF